MFYALIVKHQPIQNNMGILLFYYDIITIYGRAWQGP